MSCKVITATHAGRRHTSLRHKIAGRCGPRASICTKCRVSVESGGTSSRGVSGARMLRAFSDSHHHICPPRRHSTTLSMKRNRLNSECRKLDWFINKNNPYFMTIQTIYMLCIAVPLVKDAVARWSAFIPSPDRLETPHLAPFAAATSMVDVTSSLRLISPLGSFFQLARSFANPYFVHCHNPGPDESGSPDSKNGHPDAIPELFNKRR